MAISGDGGFKELLKSIPFDTIGQYYKQAVDYGVVDLTLHPFDYADTLIRLGYEPFLPVEEDSTMFKKKSLVLPGITNYVNYLYSIDGAHGLFRAAVPYITGNLIYRHFSTYVMNRSPFPHEHPEGEPRLCEQFTNANVGHFVRVRFWTFLSNVVAMHAAYPFHAIAIRTMARFVTNVTVNEKYRPEITETWMNELGRVKGISELYAGCQAQLFKEAVYAVISAGSFLALMKVVQLLRTDPKQVDTLEGPMNFVGNTIAAVYINPFRNISEIMVINSTDIPLGNPPFNEIFLSCWECLLKLRKDRKWKTSSSGGLFHFGRYYNGPMEMGSNGKLFPRGTYFGPMYWPREARAIDDLPYYLREYYDAWNHIKGMFESGQFGMGDPLLQESFAKQTRSSSVALSGIKGTTMMSEKVSMNILGLNSKTFYFNELSRSNPFGL